jgi:hypothetical protein
MEVNNLWIENIFYNFLPKFSGGYLDHKDASMKLENFFVLSITLIGKYISTDDICELLSVTLINIQNKKISTEKLST